MQKIETILEGKSFYSAAAVGTRILFRTYETVVCWCSKTKKVEWEVELDADSMMGDKDLLVAGESAIVFVGANENFAVTSINIANGEIQWQLSTPFSKDETRHSQYENHLYLLGSDLDGNYLILVLNLADGTIEERLNDPFGSLTVFHDDKTVCISGFSGIFGLKNGIFEEICPTEIYAAHETQAHLLVVGKNDDDEVCLGSFSKTTRQIQFGPVLPKGHGAAWLFSNIDREMVLTYNLEHHLCFIWRKSHNESTFSPFLAGKSIIAKQLQRIENNFLAIASPKGNLTKTLMQIDIDTGEVIREFSTLVLPRKVFIHDSMIFIGLARRIERWG